MPQEQKTLPQFNVSIEIQQRERNDFVWARATMITKRNIKLYRKYNFPEVPCVLGTIVNK